MTDSIYKFKYPVNQNAVLFTQKVLQTKAKQLVKRHRHEKTVSCFVHFIFRRWSLQKHHGKCLAVTFDFSDFEMF